MEQGYKDRKVGLVLFGLFQVLLGLLCTLIIPLMLYSVMSSSEDMGMTLRVMLPALLMYATAAAWFLTLGVGSILARRWARALTLMSSWFWLITGILSCICMVWLMPKMFSPFTQDESAEPMMHIVLWVTIAFLALFYIFLPGLFVFFYGSKHVKATCEVRDSKIRWTDHRPLPVLALTLCTALWGVCSFFLAAYNWALPFFGTILTGTSGALIVILISLLFFALSWGCYRLDQRAWWGCLATPVLGGVSTVITFLKVDLLSYYEKMGYPEEQMALLRENPYLEGPHIMVLTTMWVLVWVGYLLYTRRYFWPSPAASRVS